MFGKLEAGGHTPSLLDTVRRNTSHLALVSGQHLPAWLPALAPPPTGWVVGRLDAGGAPTRMLLRRKKTGEGWGGCAVLNLYAFSGRVPTEIVQAETASTLRAIGEIHEDSRPITVPARDGLHVAAASAVGEFALGGRRLHCRYTAYLVQTQDEAAAIPLGSETSRGALVEHNIFVADDTDDRMRRELTDMDDAVLAAIRTAVN